MMNENKKRDLIKKVFINGRIVVKTGLRIGGETFMINIGGLDLVVVRDPITNQPYIPGSSLKGKMRSLFERLLGKNLINTGTAQNPIYRHECGDKECKVCRLYGSSKKKGDVDENIPARIIVRDAFLTKESADRLMSIDTDLPYTEIKMENSLDRITSAANPRQIERVPAGAEFEFEIIYTSENENHEKDDIKNIFVALKLIEDDYLGWGGSRGYGKVEFKIDSVRVRTKEYYLEGEDEKKVDIPNRVDEILSKYDEVYQNMTRYAEK